MKDIFEKYFLKDRKGIVSVCSSNPLVIEAAMIHSMNRGTKLLIEATANQVNQFGGYTGMVPKVFKKFVFHIANQIGYNADDLILGGDHLGPLTWVGMDAATAMKNAEDLVRDYVLAGFTKIHVDTSMRLLTDDKSKKLSPQIIAKRTNRLVKACEVAYLELLKMDKNAIHPFYVLGSEVPTPGGIYESEEMEITTACSFREAYGTFKEEFASEGIDAAFKYVIALVVQPGVEFGDNVIIDYNRNNAVELCEALKDYDIVFEGHSTDYQTSCALSEMVEDGIKILKVGPQLTFALREAFFALNYIEDQLLGGSHKKSNFIKTLDDVMHENDKHWIGHFNDSQFSKEVFTKFSYLDRSRYYLNDKRVEDSINILFENLGINIPMSILSQFCHKQYDKIRAGALKNDARAIALDYVIGVLDNYYLAI